MINVTRTADEVRVHVTTARRPLMYLDQCALYEFAKDNGLGPRFRKFFESHGELLLSSINLFELGQLQGGSLQRAKAFLDDVVGAAWIPIEFDPTSVVQKELAGRFSPSPAISESLLDDACATLGPATFSKLLDVARHSPSQKVQWDHAKAEMGRQVEALRKEYLEDPSVLDQKYPNIPLSRRTKTLSVLFRVFRLIVEQGGGAAHFRWSANDAEDFAHAITGLAHADVVVLDGKWADRIRGLAPATVFSCGQLGEFLDWCESAIGGPIGRSTTS